MAASCNFPQKTERKILKWRTFLRMAADHSPLFTISAGPDAWPITMFWAARSHCPSNRQSIELCAHCWSALASDGSQKSALFVQQRPAGKPVCVITNIIEHGIFRRNNYRRTFFLFYFFRCVPPQCYLAHVSPVCVCVCFYSLSS